MGVSEYILLSIPDSNALIASSTVRNNFGSLLITKSSNSFLNNLSGGSFSLTSNYSFFSPCLLSIGTCKTDNLL